MKFTIRPRNETGNGDFSILASEARAAVDVANELMMRGVRGVEIHDENGVAYDLVELERRTNIAEDAAS